jgi:Transposase DDE domain group 1
MTPGVVLAQAAVAIADGAESVSDVSRVVSQRSLLVGAGSYSTLRRAIFALDELECFGLDGAVAAARERVWAAVGGFSSLTIDFDATLVECHSEKEGAAPTYKRGFGFHPLGCWLDETGEQLSGMLRAGNAGSNTTADHVELLTRAVDGLPAAYRAGHQPGDDPALVAVPILARADGAGATHDFVAELVERNIGFSVGYQVTAAAHGALGRLPDSAWQAALNAQGEARDGAGVVELTGKVPLDSWPAGTRLICRRERPHPGAAHKLSLFDQLTGWRHTVFLTDTEGDDLAALELRHRCHARVEDRVRAAKATGWGRFPSAELRFNEAWAALAGIATTLLAWTRLTCLHGDLAKAEPATLRWTLFHVAARVTRRGRQRTLHIDRTWPWRHHLAEAFARLRAALTS